MVWRDKCPLVAATTALGILLKNTPVADEEKSKKEEKETKQACFLYGWLPTASMLCD